VLGVDAKDCSFKDNLGSDSNTNFMYTPIECKLVSFMSRDLADYNNIFVSKVTLFDSSKNIFRPFSGF